jgi:uncharacterized repeat protein (TIGR01451 family)
MNTRCAAFFVVLFTGCLTGLAQNQGPTVTRPVSVTATEDVAFTFNGGNLISVADPDVGASNLVVNLSVTGSGTLQLSGVAGLTFTNGSNGSSSMAFRGVLTNINNALNNLVYSNAQNSNGTFVMTIDVNDLGHNGSGGARATNVTVSIAVAPVNDRPVIGISSSNSVVEEGQIVLPIRNLDPDRLDTNGSAYSFRFTMSATNGVFVLGSTNNLTFTAGNPVITTGGVIVITNATFEGPYAAMSNALAAVVYLPRLNANGSDTLNFTMNDLGNFGSGGVLSSNLTRTITITAVNDRPVLNVPPPFPVNENSTNQINLSGLVEDIDVNETPGGQVSVGISVTNGVITLGVTNGLTFLGGGLGTTGLVVQGTLVNIDAALATFVYTPDPFFFGFDTLRVNANDLGNTGAGGALTTNDTTVITVVEVNEAPQLDGAAVMTLTAINEDNTTSPGDTVAAILATGGNPITDTDPGAVEGIAVVAADNTGGAWQYSTNAGVSFAPVGAVLDNAALLLNPTARLRFVPNADYFGTNSITFRAWDQTSGANGDTAVDTGINGGNTAFSTNTATATLVVNPVNDAPVVVNAADFVFPDQLEDDLVPPGTAVSNLLTSLGGTQATDADGDVIAIAVTASDTANGIWEISTNDGAAYFNLNAVTAAAARQLAPDVLIRFVPNANYFGPATIAFRLWDQTAGTNMGIGNTTVNGGATAFSTLIATGLVQVLDVNEAPLLDGAATMVMTPIEVNTFASPGDTVASIIASAGNPITDSDVGDPEGFAVIAVDDQFGFWQFSTDAGANWNLLGPVTLNSATLLDGSALVRFVPLPNFSGSATFTVHAWDQATGASGLGGVDAAVNGGSTAFSTNSVDVTLTVTSTNNAPLLDNTGAMVLTSILQDNTNSPGDAVVVIVASAGGDRITDPDPSALEGLAITGVDDSNGTWQYSVNAGASWLPFGAVSDAAATLLDQDGLIRFVPGPAFAGSAEITFRAWDQSSLFISGATGVNASVNGGTTPFSTGIETARIDVIAIGVNAAPNLNNAGDMALPSIFQNNFTNTGATVGAIIASDLANAVTDLDGDPLGIAIIAADFSNGIWQYSTSTGATWNALNNISGTLAVLLDTNALVRFVPNANFNGPAGTITFRAWDRSDNRPSGSTGIDTSVNGGTSPFSAQTEDAAIEVVPMSDFIIHAVPLGTPVPGALVTYRVTVTNQGPSDATNVVVTDILPPEVTPTGTVITNLTTIFAGGSKFFTLTVEIPAALRGSLTNVASVTSENTDFTPANAATTNITALVPAADLVLTVSNRPASVAANKPFTYAITVTNLGPSDALSMTVTSVLPANVTFLGASGGVFAANTVSFGPVTLAVGRATSWLVRVKAPTNVNTTVTGVTAAASIEADPVPTNNAVITATKINAAIPGTDTDGDGKGDAVSFNSGTSTWFVRGSIAGSSQFGFGFPGVLPAMGDFDGDGKWDTAVYHPASGTWYLFRSALGFTTTQFGFAGTLPVPADYDGDGRTDLAVFEPATGTWYLFRSSLGFTTTQFGYNGSTPVPADYDGDGRDDLAVYDANAGLWFIFRSSLGFQQTSFGFPGTVAVPGDYDGDSKVDIGVYHATSGTWYLFRSKLGFQQTVFGFAGTIPAPGDYDGDGRTDLGVYDPAQARWYLQKSTQGFETFVQGTPGGKPVTVPAR